MRAKLGGFATENSKRKTEKGWDVHPRTSEIGRNTVIIVPSKRMSGALIPILSAEREHTPVAMGSQESAHSCPRERG